MVTDVANEKDVGPAPSRVPPLRLRVGGHASEKIATMTHVISERYELQVTQRALCNDIQTCNEGHLHKKNNYLQTCARDTLAKTTTRTEEHTRKLPRMGNVSCCTCDADKPTCPRCAFKAAQRTLRVREFMTFWTNGSPVR